MALHRFRAQPDRRVSRPLLVLGWIVLTFLLDLAFREHVTSGGRPVRVGPDFKIYWRAGQLLGQGHDPYQPILGKLGFVYPPFALLPFRVLAHFGRSTAFEWWLLVQAAVVALLLVLAVRRGMSAWLVVPAGIAIAFDGYVYRCVAMGQIGLVLLGLVGLDVLQRADRRNRGFLTGLAIGMKFTPAVFLVYWVLRRNWRAASMAVAGFACSVLLGFVVAPGASHRYWRDALVHHRLGTGVPSQYGNANNQSVTNAVQMLVGPSASHAQYGHVLALVLTAVGVGAAVLAGRTGRAWLVVALLGTASCLATGSTWDHHYVWSVAAILALAAGELSRLRATAAVAVLWTIWSFPRPWYGLAWHHRVDFTTRQYVEAIGTPALASLFVVVAACELAWQHRRARGRLDAAAQASSGQSAMSL